HPKPIHPTASHTEILTVPRGHFVILFSRVQQCPVHGCHWHRLRHGFVGHLCKKALIPALEVMATDGWRILLPYGQYSTVRLLCNQGLGLGRTGEIPA
ncbi:MAG: hypothetical protein QM527_04840, partial [Alphaproteobacteria bacterium]|nr:hypothetical protein [Alphaproteobacteria bacterium]